jgi:hypothetical protein
MPKHLHNNKHQEDSEDMSEDNSHAESVKHHEPLGLTP